MIDSIPLITLILSLAGMGVMIFKKIPRLLEMPETSLSYDRENFVPELKKTSRVFRPFKKISTDLFLQKILSKSRTLTLKTDNKICCWLQKIREHSQKNKYKENDDYWQKLRKSTRK